VKIFTRSTLGDCDADTTVLGGYSFITADDLDAAVQLAKPGDLGHERPKSPPGGRPWQLTNRATATRVSLSA
jgi:hypothetical protein